MLHSDTEATQNLANHNYDQYGQLSCYAPPRFKWGIGAILLFSLSVGVAQLRAKKPQSLLYPRSDTYISPLTGKPDPTWNENVLPLIKKRKQALIVDFGVISGDACWDLAFFGLSPLIRKHHELNEFNDKWHIHYPDYNVDWEFEYNRSTGEVHEIQTSRTPSSFASSRIGKNITDRDIHEGAKQSASYPQWARDNWSR